jgi:hypothetical protein
MAFLGISNEHAARLANSEARIQKLEFRGTDTNETDVPPAL